MSGDSKLHYNKWTQIIKRVLASEQLFGLRSNFISILSVTFVYLTFTLMNLEFLVFLYKDTEVIVMHCSQAVETFEMEFSISKLYSNQH